MNTEYRYVVRTKNKEQIKRLHELADNERSITVLENLKERDLEAEEQERNKRDHKQPKGGTVTEMSGLHRRGLSIAQQHQQDQSTAILNYKLCVKDHLAMQEWLSGSA